MKKLSLVLVALLLVMTSAACAGDTPPSQATADSGAATGESASPADNPSQAPGGGETIVSETLCGNPDGGTELVWAPNPSHWIATENESKVNYLSARIEEWSKANPDVKITIRTMPTNSTDLMAKALVEAVSSDLPDIGIIDGFMFPQFHQYATPVTDILERSGIALDDFFPFCQSVMVNDSGDVMGFYYTTDVRTMFYRKDLIENPPKTWDEVIAVGKEMRDLGYDNAYSFTGAASDNTAMCTLLPFYWGQGGVLFDDGDNVVIGEEPNRTYLTNAYAFVRELLDEGVTSERILTYQSDADLIAEITADKTTMVVAGNYTLSQIRSAIGDDEFDEKWGTSQIPMMEAGSHTVSSGGWVCPVFTKDEEKRELGADLLLYMYVDDEGMAGWCNAGAYLPTRRSVFENDATFANDASMQFFKGELDFSEVRPANEMFPTLNNEMLIALNEVMTGELDADAAVDKALDAYNRAV